MRVTATPLPGLRVNGSWSHDERDNRTVIASYPQVATDMFLAATPRSNTPSSFMLDRVKLGADYRGPGSWKFAGGIDYEQRERSFTEVVETRETTLWGRASVQALDNLMLAGRLAHAFITSKLTPLILIAAIAMGVAAVLLLPREEEPQIIVPMIDIFVAMPGASAAEVESRITRPMERLLWQIPGVEYIYSTASPGGNMTIVRFYVGEDEEKSIVRLNQKMFANFDLIRPGASQPLIKPRSIDDVPFLALTLWSNEIYG